MSPVSTSPASVCAAMDPHCTAATLRSDLSRSVHRLQRTPSALSPRTYVQVIPATLFGVLVIGALHRMGFGEHSRSLYQLVEPRQGGTLMAGEVRGIGPMLSRYFWMDWPCPITRLLTESVSPR